MGVSLLIGSFLFESAIFLPSFPNCFLNMFLPNYSMYFSYSFLKPEKNPTRIKIQVGFFYSFLLAKVACKRSNLAGRAMMPEIVTKNLSKSFAKIIVLFFSY